MPVNNPLEPNSLPIQGPGPTGDEGYPINTQPAVGARAQDVNIIAGGGGAVTIADGSDVSEGATTDAPLFMFASEQGSVQRVLKGMNRVLSSVWNSPSNGLQTQAEGRTSAGAAGFENPLLMGGNDAGGVKRARLVSIIGTARVAALNEHRDTPARFTVGTFRTLGNAASPQNIFTLHAPNSGQSTAICVKRIVIAVTYTAVLTAVDCEVRWGRTTALPTGGTALTPVNYDTTRTVSANVIPLGATASDGGGATAITATIANKAGGMFIGRMHTLVGQTNPGGIEIYRSVEDASAEAMILRPNEGLVIQIVNPTAGNNPTTNHYIVTVEGEEFTPA